MDFLNQGQILQTYNTNRSILLAKYYWKWAFSQNIYNDFIDECALMLSAYR